MRILLVADGRSPTTRSWINVLFRLQHQVMLVSTFPCDPMQGLLGLEVLPVAFAGLSGSQVKQKVSAAQSGGMKQTVARARSSFLRARYWLGPLTLSRYEKLYKYIVQVVKPDLVHALRIPFEGMLAAFTPPEIPLVVSIWGNDLTLHAGGSTLMQRWTARTLLRADGLAADTHRDIRLARQWGFTEERPTLVVPGNGGLNIAEIQRLQRENPTLPLFGIPADCPLVINPRGFRPGSVRNDIFFQAVSLILERNQDIQFLCPSMQDQPEALGWVQKLHLEKNTHLLPNLPQPQLWNLFSHSEVIVSVSQHDGTPNSLLEAMAIGCFPVVGDIESLREWITPGVNGMLVQPDNPQALAECILLALNTPDLRKKAAELNRQVIQQRAEINLVLAQVAVFYQRLVQ